MTAPLAGIRVLELGGIGPGPHAAMLLADLGADVVRLERPGGFAGAIPAGAQDWLMRGRRSVAVDLKEPADLLKVQQLIGRCDVLIDGFRPGVTERLGIGPQECCAANRRLIYARITGWGQDGPLARQAGHDINYLSITGVLHAIGAADAKPVPPLNLVGDFGGGSAYLVIGILAALLDRQRTGAGQVVDAAIVDGVSSLAQSIWAMLGVGGWRDDRASNLIDGGAPFYGTYRCADDRYLAVGALEPQFYQRFLQGLGLDPSSLPAQYDQAGWPRLRREFTSRIATRGRDEWMSVFDSIGDTCVTPVLSLAEAPAHPHLRARGTLREFGGVVQAAAAPRLSGWEWPAPAPPPAPGADNAEVFRDWLAPADQPEPADQDEAADQPEARGE
jgi:alpha-methylacyl-CoA racemase